MTVPTAAASFLEVTYLRVCRRITFGLTSRPHRHHTGSGFGGGGIDPERSPLVPVRVGDRPLTPPILARAERGDLVEQHLGNREPALAGRGPSWSEHARSLIRGGRPARLGGSRPDLRRRRLRRGPIRRRARETRPACSRSGRPSESTLAQTTTQCSLKRLTRPSDAAGSYVATPSNLGCVGSESGVGVEPALPLQVRDACHFRLSRLPSLAWPMGWSCN